VLFTISKSFEIFNAFLHVSEVGTVFEFFLSGFAVRLVLTLKMIVLGAELNSLSNHTTYNKDHRPKTGSYDEKPVFRPFFYSEILYFLSRFVQEVVLTLKMIVLDAEFNSLSNGTRFHRSHRHKKIVFLQIPGFSLLNLVPIHYMTCVDSENDCVGCKI
jgi:hypothetical protein